MPPQLTALKMSTEQILSYPTWDILLVFGLIAIGFFYGISTGKRRIAATLVYTYVAIALFSVVPVEAIEKAVGLTNDFLLKAGIFLLLFLLLAILMHSRIGFQTVPASAWWQIFLLSFLQSGLLVHILLNFLPPEKIKLLAPVTKNIFANQNLHFWWLFVPIATVVLIRRFESMKE